MFCFHQNILDTRSSLISFTIHNSTTKIKSLVISAIDLLLSCETKWELFFLRNRLDPVSRIHLDQRAQWYCLYGKHGQTFGGVRQRWTNLIQSDFLCCVRVKKINNNTEEERGTGRQNVLKNPPHPYSYCVYDNQELKVCVWVCVCMCVFGVGSCEGKDSWEMGKERWGFKKKKQKRESCQSPAVSAETHWNSEQVPQHRPA